MSLVSEAAVQASQLEAAIRDGLRSIDRNQLVRFTQYRRKVLPLDGYIFWINTGATIQVPGSLHYAVDLKQNEDETVSVNRVEFTAEVEIQQFNAITPDLLWIGRLGEAAASSGGVVGNPDLISSPVLFAFSSRGFFYKKADAFHYVGVAVYPALLSQLIDNPTALPDEPIVSNSLPIWLGLAQFAPVYPSFIVPSNVEPPYIAAHIEPDGTDALEAFPAFGWPGVIEPNTGASPLHQQPSSQLMRDRVRLTLYGFNNQTAIQYLVSLVEYSQNTDAFGFMNSPAIRDDKRTQIEMSMIAQKKHIEIIASYYQSTAYAIAQRLILSATCAVTVASP